MPKNMPKKVKGEKVCPEDYNHAHQSDSDQHDDPDYIYEEPTSQKISQAKGGCDTYKKRQNEKTKKSTATPNTTKGGQTSPATPLSSSPETSARALNLQSRLDTLHASQRRLQAKRARRVNIFDEVEQIEEGLQANRDRITDITPGPYNRRLRSIIWDHVTKSPSEELLLCNYCEKTWKGLYGSISNPLKHIRDIHYNMLRYCEE